MATEARRVVGDGPAYLGFDIDASHPACVPGTGTPEVGGYGRVEPQHMLRGLFGVDFVPVDLMEASPVIDQTGGTPMVGTDLLFEMLCLLAARVA